ncbi:hypothetical protein ACO0LL_27350 [Undibacterium sp. TC4M20W]|uniref:hypothetical protein n=1 Tax=Undibacterium sp. TC4M20W TaxID=3413052 RepID=UPI003BF14937
MNTRHVNLDNKNLKRTNAAEAVERSDAAKDDDALLPHERDQTTDDKTAPRKVMKQALNDLQTGKVDTDMHGARGVEVVVKPTAKTAAESAAEPAAKPAAKEGSKQ